MVYSTLHKRKAPTISTPKSWNIKDWGPAHDRILEMFSQGKDLKEIRKEVPLAPGSLKRIVTCDAFLTKLNIIKTCVVTKIIEKRSGTGEFDTSLKARELLGKESLKAAHKLLQLMHSGVSTERIQLDACCQVLERSGVIAPKEIESKTSERSYAPEEISKARLILAESQAIVARLATKPSPFVLGDTRKRTLESSATDTAHADAIHTEGSPEAM